MAQYRPGDGPSQPGNWPNPGAQRKIEAVGAATASYRPAPAEELRRGGAEGTGRAAAGVMKTGYRIPYGPAVALCAECGVRSAVKLGKAECL
jgi:hypothetical protein